MKNRHLKKYLLIFFIYFIFIGFIYLQPAKELSKKKSDDYQDKVNISGIWESNIGWKYNIKQKGNKFTWTVINRNQKASGSINKNNKEIEVIWNDNSSQGTAYGIVLEIDPQGKAIFIEWDNGVFFHRK